MIQHDVDLTKLNTFGFTQVAKHYVETQSAEQVEAAVHLAKRKGWQVLVLGGGSNLVLTQDIDALVIRQTDQSMQYTELDNSVVHLKASAGTHWHTLVMDTVKRGHIGLENLSLIPGTLGAAPVQNIGAYGVELKDRFVSLTAFHVPTMSWQEFTANDCNFTYRDSHFKHHKDEYIITDVTLSLDGPHRLNTTYRALANHIEIHETSSKLTPVLVSEAVCDIRCSKLPDPAVVPNAGSFFHNPVVGADHYQRLLLRFPEIVAYEQPYGGYKLAAGWLIDKLGFRGYQKNGVGVHESQALVLVHHGQSNSTELINLATQIQQAVRQEFDVTLTIEPRVI